MKRNAVVLRGYLIEKYNHMTGAYTCNRLVEEANALDIDLKLVGIHDTYITETGVYNGNQLLEKRDFVINRYKWGRLKDAVNHLAVRSYNALQPYCIYINKFEQVQRLRSDEFVVPRYMLGTTLLSYENIVAQLGSPFVAKGLESSMGEQILLIEDEQTYKNLAMQYDIEKEWLFEEFVSTSYGRDMRIYSVRGEVAGGMIRRSQGDFRANVALGASVEQLEITDSIRKIAADIYAQTGLDFLGIDLMYGTDKPYFCEINVMPGIEGMETATGSNIARLIMQTIKGDLI